MRRWSDNAGPSLPDTWSSALLVELRDGNTAEVATQRRNQGGRRRKSSVGAGDHTALGVQPAAGGDAESGGGGGTDGGGLTAQPTESDGSPAAPADDDVVAAASGDLPTPFGSRQMPEGAGDFASLDAQMGDEKLFDGGGAGSDAGAAGGSGGAGAPARAAAPSAAHGPSALQPPPPQPAAAGGGGGAGSSSKTPTLTRPLTVSYGDSPAEYMQGEPIVDNLPILEGGAYSTSGIHGGASFVSKCGKAPFTLVYGGGFGESTGQRLPPGLSFDPATGAISGKPETPANVTALIRADCGWGGSATVHLPLRVRAGPPNVLTYTQSPASWTEGRRVPPNVPVLSPTSGAPKVWTVSPALPDGLVISASTGIISGAPVKRQASTQYNVTGSNDAGASSATLWLAVERDGVRTFAE